MWTSATAIAVRLQNDILATYFDQTLEKYRLVSKAAPSNKHKPQSLLDLWDRWVEQLEILAATKADYYEMVRRMLVKAQPGLSDVG